MASVKDVRASILRNADRRERTRLSLLLQRSRLLTSASARFAGRSEGLRRALPRRLGRERARPGSPSRGRGPRSPRRGGGSAPASAAPGRCRCAGAGRPRGGRRARPRWCRSRPAAGARNRRRPPPARPRRSPPRRRRADPLTHTPALRDPHPPAAARRRRPLARAASFPCIRPRSGSEAIRRGGPPHRGADQAGLNIAPRRRDPANGGSASCASGRVAYGPCPQRPAPSPVGLRADRTPWLAAVTAASAGPPAAERALRPRPFGPIATGRSVRRSRSDSRDRRPLRRASR